MSEGRSDSDSSHLSRRKFVKLGIVAAACTFVGPTEALSRMLEPVTKNGRLARRKDRALLVGVGGAGGSIVEAFEAVSDSDEYTCLAIDSDPYALSTLDCEKTLAIGRQSAGGNPTKGRENAQARRQQIRRSIEGHRSVLVIAGFGGGTGTGAAPVVADVAVALRLPTRALVTLPFRFEGDIRKMQAREGLGEFDSSTVDVRYYSNNLVARSVRKPIPLRELFQSANEIFARRMIRERDFLFRT